MDIDEGQIKDQWQSQMEDPISLLDFSIIIIFTPPSSINHQFFIQTPIENKKSNYVNFLQTNSKYNLIKKKKISFYILLI